MPPQLFSSNVFLTFSMLPSLTEVNGRRAYAKFSMTLRTSLNALCHSNVCVRDKVDSSKHCCNDFNDSVAVIILTTQHFKFHSMVKISRQTFRNVNEQLLNCSLIDIWRSNFIQTLKEVVHI